MSIIVSVKINDGIVMAADSATSFAIGQIYQHANKIVNLVKGLPIGVMTCGVGGIGNASTATLLKDLRRRLAGEDDSHKDWKLDSKNYTMEAVNSRVHGFFSEKIKEADSKAFLMFRVCGYSSEHSLPEVWQVVFLDDGTSLDPCCIQPEDNFGPRWNGENEALDRIILGMGSISESGAKALGLTMEQAAEARNKVLPLVYENLILPAAPIQDAIDLARFMVEITEGFIRFSIMRPKVVGGAVEIAAITKHEGFKWVQRKHFYSSEFNADANR
jgi:hypothetical protein